jgi:hypothetical protein
MIVEWLHGASICTVQGQDGNFHAGFAIPSKGAQLFEVENFGEVVRIFTKSGDSLWLHMPKHTPQKTADLINLAFGVMDSKRAPGQDDFGEVQIPQVDFSMRPDISFMKKAWMRDKQGRPWEIEEAIQQFKLRMNKEGAHVRAATALVLRALSVPSQNAVTFDQPFIGWFTQKNVPTLPIAIFFADYDSWKATTDLNI